MLKTQIRELLILAGAKAIIKPNERQIAAIKPVTKIIWTTDGLAKFNKEVLVCFDMSFFLFGELREFGEFGELKPNSKLPKLQNSPNS